jgi:hypothetical protein
LRTTDDVTTRSARAADWIGVAGGGALLASLFLPWVSAGAGSTLHGHELVDALVAIGRTFPGLSDARLTVLWYLVPALGALAWIVIGLAGSASRIALIHAVVTLVVVVLVFLAFARLAGAGDLGTGAYSALLGGLAIAAAVVLARVS